MPILDFMDDVKPLGPNEPVPENDYELMCIECEERNSAGSSNTYLACIFEILDGEHSGRKIYQNITFKHESEKAQRYGRQLIKSWGCAARLPNATDTDDLIDRPCMAHVYIEPASGGYREKNQIAYFIIPEVEEGSKPVSEPKQEDSQPAKEAEKAPEKEDKKPAAPKGGNPWD